MTVDAAKARSIFLSAVESHAPDEWNSFLVEACQDDAALRQRVELLLRAHQGDDSLLDRGEVDEDTRDTPQPIAERPGTVIGPYKLLQQIGEGGMGVVFMAEQTEPIERTVALKIIKPGMDTRACLARFEAERQALAMMDHPNIARVLDAGTTGEGARDEERGASEKPASTPILAPRSSLLAPTTGRPYFVMELVKGVPITKYCDDNRLTVSQRLALFLQVCHAVQHAHQKGIIHRDIKPSNVLVAEYDHLPVPKIIDFGVAKATAQKLTDRTMFTGFGQLIGTFEYMSPEQAKFNALDIDTRSDIYSLGVLLYELLVGSTPLDRSRLETVAFDETLRIIREEDPPKPSTRLGRSGEPSRTDLAGSPALLAGPMPLATIAANRQTEPTKLSKEVRGELDWIVMKALEKDRDRRYETAAALAADLTHYLADEPVTAAAPSQLYRIHKFIRRNRVPVIAATLVAVAILAGVAASTLQAVRATRAERAALASAKLAQESAEREASQRKKAEDIVSFLISAYQVDNPEPDSQSVAEVLKHSAQKLQDAYPDNPGARAVVLSNIGRSYVRLRRFEDAEQIYRKCLALAKDPGLINIVHQEFANCLLRLGKYDEAVEILQPVVLEKANHSGAPDAIELREAWPRLPDTQATPRGKPGMDGLDFDGERDYVILSRMFFDGRPPWTLEAIVRPIAIEQAVPDGWTSLVSAANGGSISLDTNQRRWAIELHTALISSDDWTKNYSTATSRTEVVLGEWQHVAGVWDGHELRLYLNGQLQETRTGVEFCADLSLAPMFLGADPSASYIDMAQGYLLGRMRAVRISRVAKYTDSFPRPERLDNTPGTIGLYDFTIDTGRYAFDQSGHGNHGIIIGATFAKASE